MSTQIGRGHIVGLSGGTLTFSPTLVGSVTYDERSLRVSHNGSIAKITGKGGDTKGLIAVDEFLECAFNFIPYGTTIAAAKVSAQAPDLLAGCTISGMPVIIMGVFTDALNTSADGQPWIYEGGWEVNGTGDGEPWSASFTLRRYSGISSATPIT